MLTAVPEQIDAVILLIDMVGEGLTITVVCHTSDYIRSHFTLKVCVTVSVRL